MNNNKVIAIVLGAVAALFAVSLVMRFFMLSAYGVSGSWMYFSLPLGGIGLFVLLLRLGLLNFGERSAPAVPVSARLQQLDGMRSAGAISEAEYHAKREQIISTI